MVLRGGGTRNFAWGGDRFYWMGGGDYTRNNIDLSKLL